MGYSDSLDNLLYTANNSRTPVTTQKKTTTKTNENSSTKDNILYTANNTPTVTPQTPTTVTPQVTPQTTTVVDTTPVAPNPSATTNVAGTDDTVTRDNTSYNAILEQLIAQNQAYQDYITSMEDKEAEALAAQKAAIQAGVDQSVNTLNNEKSNVNTSYANTLRQLYIDKMNAQKNIGQQMAAAGQTGGQAESTLLGLNTNYADNLRQSEQAKSSALSELETAIANAKLSGSAEEANAIATNTQNGISNYLSAMNNLIGNGTSLASLTSSNENTAKSTAYEKAMTFLSSGVMPDTTTLANAGISTTEAQKLVNAINAQKKSTSTDTSAKEAKERADYLLKAIGYGSSISEADKQAIMSAYPGFTWEQICYNNGLDPTAVSVSGGTDDGGDISVEEYAKTIYQSAKNSGMTNDQANVQVQNELYNAYKNNLISLSDYKSVNGNYHVTSDYTNQYKTR